MTLFDLHITRPAPSMSQDVFTIEAETYEDAVTQAHAAHDVIGRHVGLTARGGVYVYRSIYTDGTFEDRNDG